MLKLYLKSPNDTEYWEMWENEDGSHTVHWGVLGTTGESRQVTPGLSQSAESEIQIEVDARVASGFCQIDIEDHVTLMIEFDVEGMGTPEDVERRGRLEDRMNELLGWTGLGACDGGSTGSGTMEVCCFVVDFDIAKGVIMNDLVNSEFSGYTRIYDEDA